MHPGALRRIGSRLLLLAALTITGCRPNRAEVRHPHLTAWHVCMRPPNVEPDARQWAVNSDTGTTVSNVDPDAFEEFLPHADALYIFDFNAPAESAQLLPDEYAANSCDGPDRILARQVNESSTLPSSARRRRSRTRRRSDLLMRRRISHGRPMQMLGQGKWFVASVPMRVSNNHNEIAVGSSQTLHM
jgi:hypothetical protein